MKAGEGDARGWDGWMASPTRWTRVWASSWRWWGTGKPGVLRSTRSQSRTSLREGNNSNKEQTDKVERGAQSSPQTVLQTKRPVTSAVRAKLRSLGWVQAGACAQGEHRPGRQIPPWVRTEQQGHCHPSPLTCTWVRSHVHLCDPTDCRPQAPLSTGFSRQDCLSMLPFPPSEDPPNPGIEPKAPALAGGFFTTKPPGEPQAHWGQHKGKHRHTPVSGAFSATVTNKCLSQLSGWLVSQPIMMYKTRTDARWEQQPKENNQERATDFFKLHDLTGKYAA